MNDLAEISLSVVMATYNDGTGNSLKCAVNSVLGQTYRNFEFIICDDASTDNTWQILNEFARQDSRIHVIRNKQNRKAGYSRNRAIHLARGQYIAIMDSDDVLHPQRLELQIKFLESHVKYGFVGCGGRFFHTELNDGTEDFILPETPRSEDLLFSLPFIHASCMFRREVLISIGGYDTSPKRIRVEDYDMLLRVYEAGYCGANMPDILYYIRKDENQYRRRKYRYRFNEADMKYQACRRMGVWPSGIVYVIKPLIVGVFPVRLTELFQKKYYGKQG